MSLIDQSYFQAELAIANLGSNSNSANIELFIKKYEKEVLIKLLGLKTYVDFDAASKLIPIPQPWLDLVEGENYTYDGKLREWVGFVNDEKQSIIANYVYFHWNQNLAYQSVGIGTVQQKAENANVVSPVQKMVRSWNEMIEMVKDFHCYMIAKKADFPDWVDFDCETKEYFSPINEFNI